MTDGEAPTMLIHAEAFEASSASDAAHVERVVLAAESGEIPVARILDFLGDRGIQSLMIEGGPDTWARFLTAGLVDRAHLCQSPVELSGSGDTFGEADLEAAGLHKINSLEVSEDTISHRS